MAKTLHVLNTIPALRERFYIASVGKQNLLKLLSPILILAGALIFNSFFAQKEKFRNY